MTEFVTVSLQGGREKVDGAKVGELISQWSTAPQSVTLSNKSFDCDAANALAQYLDKIESTDALKVLDMSDVIAGRPEDEALAALRIMSAGFKRFALHEVNLSDNALGAKGINACRDVLENMPLKKLFVCNNGLSAESVQELGEILIANELCKELALLNFYNNMSGTPGAIAFSKIISHFPALRDLRFSATRAGAEGCLEIAKSIADVQSLKKLDLMDNTFGPAAIEELFKNLAKHTELEFLNLRDDNLKAGGILNLTKTLSDVCFPRLKFLDLSGNELNAKSIARLAEWLPKAAPQLEELLLDDNEFGTEGCMNLSALIRQLKSLRRLSVSVCEIGGNGGLRLARTIQRVIKKRNKKSTSTSKFVVNLDGNFFRSSALSKIEELLTDAELAEFNENDEDADEDDSDDDEEEEEEEEEEKEKEEEEQNQPEVKDADVDKLAEELSKTEFEK